MRVFSAETESALHRLELARTWLRSGLIRREQLAAIEQAIGPVPASAGTAVRLLFAAFACLAQLGVAWLLGNDLRDRDAWGALLLALAVPAYAFGELLIRRSKLYRFGVEEGLIAGGAFQACLGFLLLVDHHFHLHGKLDDLLNAAVAAAGSWFVYARFGYLYAAFLSLLALGGVVISLDFSEPAGRLALAGLYAALLCVSYRREPPDWDRGNRETLRGALFLGAYLVLNLRLADLIPYGGGRQNEAPAFLWTTFALIWILPAAAVAAGTRLRERALLVAGGIAAILTLMTRKPYLGLMRYDWDPMLLGLLLLGIAIALARWLKAGPNGLRNGFTAEKILEGRPGDLDAAMAFAAATAASAAGGVHSASARETQFKGGGGQSGGAGAHGSF